MKKPGKQTRKPATPPKPGRVQLFDLLRGFAIVLMIGYHFCFDLKHYGLAHFDFNHDPFWLAARGFILTLFLVLVGVSLTLSAANGFKLRPYLARLGWLGAAALLTSAASYMMFPQSWIFFGVLHFILFASVIGLAFLQLVWLNLGLGLGLLWAGLALQHAAFDHPWLQWVGFTTHKPLTVDYVPLAPWLGIVLIGMFLGKLFLRSPWKPALSAWRSNRAIARALALAGRHSLLVYMLHQPVLMGLLWLGVRMLKTD